MSETCCPVIAVILENEPQQIKAVVIQNAPQPISAVVIEQIGPPGNDGTDGVGVPAGGTTGQVLAKASGADFDDEWIDNTPITPLGARPTTLNEVINGGVILGLWP